ncbi:hypothetical protein [Planctobacterium marinum]|uniref:Uncharacterized protein n=1 Tax=Planctobacterium marinum TaxID=1631968 RepID=A0AA48HG80_9ALTE|nr:hypothetical protein MACH26_18890 [Planctobacterium marinum]
MNVENLYKKLVAIDPDLPQLVVVLLDRCSIPVCQCRQEITCFSDFVLLMEKKEIRTQEALARMINATVSNPNVKLCEQGYHACIRDLAQESGYERARLSIPVMPVE